MSKQSAEWPTRDEWERWDCALLTEMYNIAPKLSGGFGDLTKVSIITLKWTSIHILLSVLVRFKIIFSSSHALKSTSSC